MKTVLLLSVMALSSFAHSADEPADNVEIKQCLKAWGSAAPFKANSPFRTIKARVKVMGIGGDLEDTAATPQPELILVRPAVSVLTKQVFKLMNPNGWYCLKGTVTVLGKAEITAHCNTHIASSDEGTTIGGSDKTGAGTATVLGKVQVNRVGCK